MVKVFVLILLSLLPIFVKNSNVDLKKLISEMSDEDKCGQMTQVTFNVVQKDQEPSDSDENPLDLQKLDTAIKGYKVGSILNTPFDKAQKSTTWQKVLNSVQDVAADTKLKIPILYGLDSIHGANYIRESVLFPQPLSMAATFNSKIAEKIGAITAMETRAIGIPWNFNPVLDIGRQPLWPRLYETYGEDVYLASKMGTHYIHGSQGDDLKNRTKVATCLKHFIGYSYPLNGRDRSVAWIPEIILREYFLPSFAAGVKAGSPTVMINSGDVNGVPGHADSFYMNDILKGELEFKGFTVSDWEDVKRLYERDKVASSPEEAVRMAVMAGLDMSMVPMDFSFFNHCISLSQKNSEFKKRVDDSVLRILQVKKDLGLFENSKPLAEDLKNINTDDSNEFNLEAARESIILAKNDNNTLPLNKTLNILVTGPTGNLTKVLNGGWSYTWQGNVEQNFIDFGSKKFTVFEAIKKKNANTTYSQGADFTKITNIDETLDLASNSDVIVLCIGEETYTESFGNIENLAISDAQVELAEKLSEINVPIIVVYLGGRPRIIGSIVDKAKSVLVGFLPGNRGGEAIADIIFGDYNPDARFPITYPRNTNGFVTYDRKPIEDVNSTDFLTGNNYVYQFPFGHGLSYTSFEYSNLVLNTTDIIHNPNGVQVSVDVENTGQLNGKETVILYLNDQFGSVSRPLRQVKGFEKVFLKAGEKTNVKFELSMYDMSFINQSCKRVVEDGRFNIYIEKLSTSFEFSNKKEKNSSSSNFNFKYFKFEFIFLILIGLAMK